MTSLNLRPGQGKNRGEVDPSSRSTGSCHYREALLFAVSMVGLLSRHSPITVMVGERATRRDLRERRQNPLPRALRSRQCHCSRINPLDVDFDRGLVSRDRGGGFDIAAVNSGLVDRSKLVSDFAQCCRQRIDPIGSRCSPCAGSCRGGHLFTGSRRIFSCRPQVPRSKRHQSEMSTPVTHTPERIVPAWQEIAPRYEEAVRGHNCKRHGSDFRRRGRRGGKRRRDSQGKSRLHYSR
jgi:hypothetical protein